MEPEKILIKNLLQSKSELIAEETLEKLFPSLEAYQKTLHTVSIKLGDLGLELIRTTFEGRKYFILGMPSEQSPLSEELLGILILASAYLKNNNETVSQEQFENIFAEVMAEVNQLIEQGYIQKKDNNYILHPRSKVLLKNIYKTLDFQKLL